MIKKVFFLLMAMAILLPSSASALFLDLLPSGDQWIRSSDSGTAYTGDAMSVRGFPTDTRWSILQFDLSGTGFTGADLLSASLDLNVRSGATNAGQNAALIDITSGTQAIDSITWNQYQIDYAGFESPLSVMGNIPEGTPFNGGDVVNTIADASDLAAIAATIDGATGSLLTFVFAPTSDTTNNDWTDGPGQLDNKPSILRLEFPGVLPPPPPCEVCEVDPPNSFWIRTGDPGAHISGDGLIVTENHLGVLPNDEGYGIADWDLSGITGNPANLIGATLELFVAHAGTSTHPGQVASLFDATTGTPINSLNLTSYLADYAGTEVALEGLGVVPDVGVLNPAAGESFLTTATAADLDLIRAILNGASGGHLSMFMASSSDQTGQYWGNDGYGTQMKLTLTFAPVPEPNSLLMVSICLVGLAMRRD